MSADTVEEPRLEKCNFHSENSPSSPLLSRPSTLLLRRVDISSKADFSHFWISLRRVWERIVYWNHNSMPWFNVFIMFLSVFFCHFILLSSRHCLCCLHVIVFVVILVVVFVFLLFSLLSLSLLFLCLLLLSSCRCLCCRCSILDRLYVEEVLRFSFKGSLRVCEGLRGRVLEVGNRRWALALPSLALQCDAALQTLLYFTAKALHWIHGVHCTEPEGASLNKDWLQWRGSLARHL